MTDMISKEQVSEILGVTPRTVQKWEQHGRISSLVMDSPTTGYPTRMYYLDQVMSMKSDLSTEITLNDDFGYYLSGLVDGEGSFGLAVRSRHQSVQNEASMKLSMRIDDMHLIRMVYDNLGFGTVGVQKAHPPSRPTAKYEVSSHLDAMRLVNLFDRYPLRGKKSRDYSIWREFVIERDKDVFSQDRLNYLSEEIRKCREFQEPSKEEISLFLKTKDRFKIKRQNNP